MTASRNNLSFSQINLATMSIIELSQRPATSTSCSRQVGNSVAVRDGRGDRANQGGGGSFGDLNKFNKLVPKPDDEPPVVCQLSGYTMSVFVELCGWSFFLPLRFFNIKPSTHLHAMTDGRGEVVKEAEELRAKVISLQEVEHLAGNVINQINCPVFVHVVSKRKVDVITYQNKVLIIPLVVIADDTGYCVLCSINEGLATIYNQVDVGDKLLISRYIPQVPRRTYHRGLFSKGMFLNLELKVQFHSVRNHYLWKFSPLKMPQFIMPLALFESDEQLKVPSELEEELRRKPIPTLLPGGVQPPSFESEDKYYDLIAVVTYVGRIERFLIDSPPPEVMCLEDDKLVSKELQRWILYRWIHVVDRTSKPFPVKVFVNNITIPHQPSLLPGAIVVLSHCQTLMCHYSGYYTATTSFSQMYLEGNVEKYFKLHPAYFRDKAKTRELLARNNYIQIMSRDDIQLSLGGTHSLKISHRENFRNLFFAKRLTLWQNQADGRSMMRRESRRLYFEGMILRVLKVDDENLPVVHYIHKENYTPHMLRKREGVGYKTIENFYSYSNAMNSSWYSFQRKLPPFDGNCLVQQLCRDIVKKIVTTYKPLCGPLLMPAEMPGYQESGPPPKLAQLEKLDGAPYLLMDIVNQDTVPPTWYTVIWKSRQFTSHEMLEKVEAAKEKKIVCLAEVFCTEPLAPLEVNLLDFVW